MEKKHLSLNFDSFIMEKRHPKRVIVSLVAELISEDKSYVGIIENLSEKGIFMKISSTNTAIGFIPGNTPMVKFQISSGETLNLRCEIRWLHTYKTPTHDLINKIGMEIIDPPTRYKEFFKTLY
jgi:hypothetical protein